VKKQRSFLLGVVLVFTTALLFSLFAQVPDNPVSAPTPISQALVEAVDKAGGSWIDWSMALLIVGLPIIALYRVLQWFGGRVKVPVGTVGCRIISAALALLLGSEAAWKNRVLSRDAPPAAARDEKAALLSKLRKDNPLVSSELKKITDEMFGRRA